MTTRPMWCRVSGRYPATSLSTPATDDDIRLIPDTWLDVHGGRLTIGRHKTCAIQIDQPWVSNTHVALEPFGLVWRLVNASRVELHLVSRHAPEQQSSTTRVPPLTSVYLGCGRHTVTWPLLKEGLELRFSVEPAPADPKVAAVRDRIPPRDHHLRYRGGSLRGLLTDREGRAGRLLDERRRRRLAEVFRHLLVGASKPANIYVSAADRLTGRGDPISPDALKKYVREQWISIHPEGDAPRLDTAAFGAGLVARGEIAGDDLAD